MTALGTQGDSDEPAPGPLATYDLIICHQDRIVFHDHYESPEQRLRMCVGILTDSDVLADTIMATRAARIHDLHNAYIAQRQTSPREIGAIRDEVVDALAKLCREWGVQLYVSTTAKKSAAPERLYSVITEYAPSQTVAEHFPDRASRTASLVERAEHFFASPGHIPAIALTDEQRLAALVSTFLMPATVALTESVLDADEGVYRPDSNTAPIRCATTTHIPPRKREISMPASTIVASGGEFRLYGDSVQTFTDLPVATYTIAFSQMAGHSLRQTEPLASAEETVYGSHASRVQRIVTGYAAMDRSLGVILSGDKGMGKSLMLRLLAERMRDERQLPTVLVQHDTPGLAAFLDELGEVVIVFDEFEKIFSNEDDESQNQFLSLFDGLSTTKRLYVLSVNELHRVNDYMLNRPGRFHYHMRFAYPEPGTVATYLYDQVPGVAEKQVAEIVDFSRKYDINFDHLRAIAFELRLGESFAEVIGDLNIKRSEHAGSRIEAHITWKSGDTDVLDGRVDLFNSDSLQTINDWDTGTGLQFRLRDAVPSEDGYLLLASAFTLTDLRDEEDKSPDDKRDLSADSVTLRRPPKYSIDF